MIYLTAGTGFSANTWYKVTGKTSDDVLTLYADVANTADVAANVTDATYSETNRCRIGLEVEVVADLTDPARSRSLAEWFERANRARDLLRTTVRADLVIVEVLRAWRVIEGRHASGKSRA